MAEVGQDRRFFTRIREIVAVQIQDKHFHLLAVHRISSERFHNSFTSPLSRAEARFAAFPISPAEARGHGGAASGWFRSGSRSCGRLLRSSFLPTRTLPRLRETRCAIRERRFLHGACARAFLPTSPA